MGYTPCRCAEREGQGMTISVAGEGRLPTKGYRDDAGFDLYTYGDQWVRHDRFSDLGCGVSIELPPGVWAMIVGRSSAIRAGLLVVNSIIDTGWRGQLGVGVWCLGDTRIIRDGERIGQLIPMQNLGRHWSLRKVDELMPSERGTNGFGSTGK